MERKWEQCRREEEVEGSERGSGEALKREEEERELRVKLQHPLLVSSLASKSPSLSSRNSTLL